MAAGGRICPHCKRYTAKDEPRCIHCNGYLGPEWLVKFYKALGENGLMSTNLLAGLCAVVFIAQYAMKGDLLRFGAMATGHDINEPWRMLTACFVHIGILHFIFNMIALFDFGRALEPRIKWQRFMLSFVVTGIIGFAVSIYWYRDHAYVTAGASGAIFGVQGVTLGLMLARKDKDFNSSLFRAIAYSVLFWMFMPTNQAAHMGGLFSGIALGYVFGKEKRPWHRDKAMTIAAVIAYLTCVATLVYSQISYSTMM